MQRARLPLVQEVIDGEACILQDPRRQAATEIAARVDWNGHCHLSLRIPEGEVTSLLPYPLEPPFFKEGDQIRCRELWQTWSHGTAMDSCST